MASKLFHIFDTTCHKESLDSLLKGPHSTTWTGAVSNELGRLAQGIKTLKEMMSWILYYNQRCHRIV